MPKKKQTTKSSPGVKGALIVEKLKNQGTMNNF